MEKNVTTTVKQTEITRDVYLVRCPPGDRWAEPDNMTLVFESLTDGLQHLFDKYHLTEFYMSAKKGTVEVLDVQEREEEIQVEVPKEEPKRYSLYDE